MKEWEKWVQPLTGYNVFTTFIWIVPRARGAVIHQREAKYEVTEKGKRGARIYPRYAEATVALGEVDREMWWLYDLHFKKSLR